MGVINSNYKRLHRCIYKLLATRNRNKMQFQNYVKSAILNKSNCILLLAACTEFKSICVSLFPVQVYLYPVLCDAGHRQISNREVFQESGI